MRQCRWLLTIVLLLAAGSTFAVPRGQKWEQTIPTNTTYDWTTARLCVQYTSPTGKVYTGTGFWHSRMGSADTFKIRAAFNETGTWGWTLLSDPGCINTASVTIPSSGTVGVTADTTGNPIYANGPVRVNVTGRYLVLSGNAARFHWAGDTSWAGPHRAPLATWGQFTSDRLAEGFSVIQVAAPIASGAIAHVDGVGAPFSGAGCNSGQLPRAGCLPNPAFWSAWDARIDDINAKQMLAVVIGVYKRVDESAAWPTLDASKGYARFIAARLAGNYTAVSPGFDEVPNFPAGDFTTNCANTAPNTENQGCRAREVGRAINEAILLQTSIAPPLNASRNGLPLSALVTHHIGGGCPSGGDGTHGCLADAWLWVFHGEDWLDFSMVQSGQGAPANCVGTQEECIAKRSTLRILALYDVPAIKPVVNGESIYDNFGWKPNATCTGSFGTLNDNYGDLRARQTAFNTFLSGGVGFTHGVAGTWDWGGAVTCRTVNDSLNAASAVQIGNLRKAFSTLPWQRLVPDCQQWGQPCTDIKNGGQLGAPWISKRMYAADASGHFAVGYLPKGLTGPVMRLELDKLPGFSTAPGTTWRADWYNPRAGCTCAATGTLVAGTTTTYDFPQANNLNDWGLIIRNTATVSAPGVGACAPANCQ